MTSTGPVPLHPAKIFLILALIFGAGFLLLLPPFQPPDEAFHLLRSYQISEGNFFEQKQNEAVGAQVPVSLTDFVNAFVPMIFRAQKKTSGDQILSFDRRPLDPRNTVFYPYSSSIAHPPFCYLPQTLGILLAKALWPTPVGLLYFGRILNFLFWLALSYWAIRITPVYPWLMALLALLPMSLHQAASLSPDAWTNGMALLVTALFLRMALGSMPRVKWQNLASVGLATLGLTLAKPVYVAHALLFFLIPFQKLESKRKYFAAAAGILLVNLLGLYIYSIWNQLAPPPEFETQKAALLREPLHYLWTLLSTFGRLGRFYLQQFVGNFGHIDTPLPFILPWFYLGLLLGVAATEREPVSGLSWKRKSWPALIVAFEIVAIFTGLYLTWPSQGSKFVVGAQGRYFIPLAPVFFLLFYRPGKNGASPSKWIGWICSYSMLMTLSISVWVLIRRFWLEG